MAQFFILVSFLVPNLVAAQGFNGLSLTFLLLFCGFIVPTSQTPKAWIFITYLNPVYYGFQALAVNEFRSPTYEIMTAAGKTLGQVQLEGKGLSSEKNWMWLGPLANLIIFTAYLILTALAATFIEHPPKVTVSADDDVVVVDEGAHDTLNKSEKTSSRGSHSGGESLPFSKVTLAFKDLWYTVPLKNKESVDLLKGITGIAEPGTMTALMGRLVA